MLQKYLMKVKELIKEFFDIEFRLVPREERADVLSKLASTKLGGNNQSLIQETLKFPSITESLSTLAIEGVSNWITELDQQTLWRQKGWLEKPLITP